MLFKSKWINFASSIKTNLDDWFEINKLFNTKFTDMGKELTHKELMEKFDNDTITIEEAKTLIQILISQNKSYSDAYNYVLTNKNLIEDKIKSLHTIIDSMFPR